MSEPKPIVKFEFCDKKYARNELLKKLNVS